MNDLHWLHGTSDEIAEALQSLPPWKPKTFYIASHSCPYSLGRVIELQSGLEALGLRCTYDWTEV